MKNLPIPLRIAVAFGTILVLLIVVSATGALNGNRLAAMTKDVTGRRLGMYSAGKDLTTSVLQSARHTRNMLILDHEKVPAEVASTRAQRDARVAKFELINKGVASPEGKQLAAAIEAARNAYDGPEAEYLRLVEAQRWNEARAYLLDAMRPAQLELLKQLEAFAAFQSERMAAAAEQLQSDGAKAELLIVGAAVASLIAAAAVGWLLSRSIVRPVQRAVHIAERVAAGDLTVAIDVDRRDETGRLLEALKTMNANLVRLVGGVRDATGSLATGTQQIASGNLDLSQRTEKQASSLQQTVASMNQLSGALDASVDTAREASRLADQASAAAAESGVAVDRFVGTMNDITTSSRRIADIISVIDGIAFQTNILALNAAVEAARAGEQGRGFAVVASEVRSLAQRSSGAAREIKGLIQDSVEKVESGSAVVEHVAKTIGGLVGQVREVSGMMLRISTTAGEQRAGIAQINGAVTQLDEATQQNAALVEEGAAAAESLNQQATRLVESVAAFRTAA